MSSWLQAEVDIRTNSLCLCAVIAAWLNASKRSRDGIGINEQVYRGGGGVKCTAL